MNSLSIRRMFLSTGFLTLVLFGVTMGVAINGIKDAHRSLTGEKPQ